jgi:hypothetical protein
MNPADEISQALRRQVLANDRKVAEERRLSTYHAVAQGSIDDERQGRFAAIGKTTITGASPTNQYLTQPLTAPSNQLALMPEEPLIDGRSEGLTLGYEIDRPEATAPETKGDGGLVRKGWRRL